VRLGTDERKLDYTAESQAAHSFFGAEVAVSMVARRRRTFPERRVAPSDRRRVPRGGRRASDHASLDRALSAATALLQPSNADRRPLVLVADGFPDGRQMLCEYLTFRGFRVESAENGQQALDKAEALLPDVMVLDLMLPDVDGLTVIRRLKACVRTKPIKVVVLTTDVMGEARQRVLDAGAAAFVPKPCDIKIVALQLVGLAMPPARWTAATRRGPRRNPTA